MFFKPRKPGILFFGVLLASFFIVEAVQAKDLDFEVSTYSYVDDQPGVADLSNGGAVGPQFLISIGANIAAKNGTQVVANGEFGNVDTYIDGGEYVLEPSPSVTTVRIEPYLDISSVNLGQATIVPQTYVLWAQTQQDAWITNPQTHVTPGESELDIDVTYTEINGSESVGEILAGVYSQLCGTGNTSKAMCSKRSDAILLEVACDNYDASTNSANGGCNASSTNMVLKINSPEKHTVMGDVDNREYAERGYGGIDYGKFKMEHISASVLENMPYSFSLDGQTIQCASESGGVNTIPALLQCLQAQIPSKYETYCLTADQSNAVSCGLSSAASLVVRRKNGVDQAIPDVRSLSANLRPRVWLYDQMGAGRTPQIRSQNFMRPAEQHGSAGLNEQTEMDREGRAWSADMDSSMDYYYIVSSPVTGLINGMPVSMLSTGANHNYDRKIGSKEGSILATVRSLRYNYGTGKQEWELFDMPEGSDPDEVINNPQAISRTVADTPSVDHDAEGNVKHVWMRALYRGRVSIGVFSPSLVRNAPNLIHNMTTDPITYPAGSTGVDGSYSVRYRLPLCAINQNPDDDACVLFYAAPTLGAPYMEGTNGRWDDVNNVMWFGATDRAKHRFKPVLDANGKLTHSAQWDTLQSPHNSVSGNMVDASYNFDFQMVGLPNGMGVFNTWEFGQLTLVDPTFATTGLCLVLPFQSQTSPCVKGLYTSGRLPWGTSVGPVQWDGPTSTEMGYSVTYDGVRKLIWFGYQWFRPLGYVDISGSGSNDLNNDGIADDLFATWGTAEFVATRVGHLAVPIPAGPDVGLHFAHNNKDYQPVNSDEYPKPYSPAASSIAVDGEGDLWVTSSGIRTVSRIRLPTCFPHCE